MVSARVDDISDVRRANKRKGETRKRKPACEYSMLVSAVTYLIIVIRKAKERKRVKKEKRVWKASRATQLLITTNTTAMPRYLKVKQPSGTVVPRFPFFFSPPC